MAKAKVNTSGTMSLGELQSNLMKTKQFSHVSEMDNHILNAVKSDGENIGMPTVGFFGEVATSYREEMIKLYNGTFGSYDCVDKIPDDVKVSQGALLDSLCYGYDISGCSSELYTMNPGIFIPEMSMLSAKDLDNIMEKNRVGLVKAYRVDIEYDNIDENNVNFKLVNHRKEIDDNDLVALVPYLAGIRLSLTIQKLLKTGYLLKTMQIKGDVRKMRCITTKQDYLKKFCDIPEATDGVEASFYPLKSFFYAPVLGAPSNTAMVTNVNLFDLCDIKIITSAKQVQELGISKCDDATTLMVVQDVIKTQFLGLKVNNIEKFAEIFEKLPRREELLSDATEDDMTSYKLSTYMHSLTNQELSQVLKLVPNYSELVSNRKSVLSSCRQATQEELGDLKSLIRNNVCRFIIQKSDFTLSSITCTNSEEILKKVYGEDYFKLYESFGVRVGNVVFDIEKGKSLEDAFTEYGLDADVDIREVQSKIAELREAGSTLSDGEIVREVIYEVSGRRRKSSFTSDVITVRTLDGYLTGKNGEDYYVYLDPKKIKKAFVLS